MAALTSLVTYWKTAVNQWTPLAIPGLAWLEVRGASEVVGTREPGGSEAMGMQSRSLL